jgi:LmbE family N-acetylglucosaminyl deacetylase
MKGGKKLRVLAVGAHPDDIELGCAGTLARCVQRGDEVTVAVVCKGDTASTGVDPDELSRVRSQEAQESVGVLGAEIIEIGLPDYGVEISDRVRRIFVDIVRRANPDVVLTHYLNDYCLDHNNTFALMRDATLAATVRNVITDLDPIREIPKLYMMEPFGGHGFLPTEYVDITETFQVKLRMLECHRSQMTWVKERGGMDFAEYVQTVARFRGYQCQVKYAEGFRTDNTWAHIPAERLLP